MNIVKVKCPDCGAILDVNKDSGPLWCRYCGCDLTPKNTYRNRTAHIGKNASLSYDKPIPLRIKLKVFLKFVLVAYVVLFCFGYAIDAMDTVRLMNMERQIQNDISLEDYEGALLKARELSSGRSVLTEKDEYWGQKASDYENKIIEMKRMRDASDPSYIPAPDSSEELVGRYYTAVESSFEEAGFTNVTLVEELAEPIEIPSNVDKHGKWSYKTIDPIMNWTRGSVIRIDFGLLDNFTTEDHCKPNDEIVIYYHGDGREIPQPDSSDENNRDKPGFVRGNSENLGKETLEEQSQP